MIGGRILTNLTRLGRLVEDSSPGIIKAGVKVGKRGADIVGKTTIGGIKGALTVGDKAIKKVADITASGGAQKLASNAGKFISYAAQDVETTAHGINNIAGWATNGFETKMFNNARNKILNTNKYTGRRAFNILKDSDESLLLGKRATKFGVLAISGGAAIMSTKDAVQDKIRQQQGVMTGSASNAPVNNYAYQGASYADNAGATGDLVLSMHRQRHSGIL